MCNKSCSLLLVLCCTNSRYYHRKKYHFFGSLDMNPKSESIDMKNKQIFYCNLKTLCFGYGLDLRCYIAFFRIWTGFGFRLWFGYNNFISVTSLLFSINCTFLASFCTLGNVQTPLYSTCHSERRNCICFGPLIRYNTQLKPQEKTI